MVDVGLGFTGLKQSHGVWTNKLLLGGSAFDQTTGPIGELAVSGTQSNFWLSGTISGTGMNPTVWLSGVNANLTGSLTAQTIFNSAGSPWGAGMTYTFTARAICSGGAFVWLSGPALAMGSPAIVAGIPIGVALATAGSNATVNVMTHGIGSLLAEGTVEAGVPVKPGVGVAAGAYNSVLDAGSPSFGVVGTAVTRAVSGTANYLLVYIGKGASH